MEKEQLEEIVEKMCDEYCRFPHICNEEELSDICDKCPLNKLIGKE